ncbi:hypothetical protein H6G20_18720 [Desertifilum sp. FACHB-1129]|uniref:Uncharacterized protein n=2 Tax=Desertifilum tharense IPPAS B-1220 TaxID=1781255 RepID=A0A1E5QN24_9CYAN|nr:MULTISPECIES: hypothetical protein [Desertifilum]MDA0213357.1 hypothetical protein [Cyanobacteria bacterium FC1]MBD2313705.1 hypothetical protein [Desertifilum sp. FACHB-1129]MBD2324999.1 hypothetical protein [Desertifilum sp. FACHB-866]MBD2335138.1 hypothetical protein [Desertifilum sp. FACHB-868]OEJ75733.1 hypothetical protein BH720_08120 [Desertifilum tharense IPPAS B-1220]
MKIHWKKLLFSLTIWLISEISLTLIGLDDLADYSEFICHQNVPEAIAIREFGKQEQRFGFSPPHPWGPFAKIAG